MKRVVLIILDGLADRCWPELGDKSPLEAAYTPNLDRLASMGLTGLLQPLARGLAPGSEVAHFVLFGYPLEKYPGRGVFEAAGEDMPVSMDDVVYRGLFCTVGYNNGTLNVIKRPVDMEDELLSDLSKDIAHYEHNGVTCDFVFNSQKQGIVYVRGDVSHEVTDSDPYLENLPIIKVEPLEGAEHPENARKTAECLNLYLRQVYKTLSAHPINKAQVEKDKPQANFLLVKWCGRKQELIPFEKMHGFKAASISSGTIYKGIASELGMDWIGIKYLPSWEDDLLNRLKLAEKALTDGYEYIHVHTKGPDHAAHEKDPKLKRDVIELLDKALGYLFDSSLLNDDNLIIITGDHGTPSGTDLLHSGEAVPIVMLGRNAWKDSVTIFNEKTCVFGGLGRIDGKDMMPTILNMTDRIKYYSAKLQPYNANYWPKKLNPLEID